MTANCSTLLKLFCLAALLSQAACISNPRKASMEQLLGSGRLVEAAQIAEAEDQAESDVLPSLNKGMLRRMTGNYKDSNAIFEKAKRRIEELYGVSITSQLGALAINDTLRDYSGDRYEQVLLHAYMALNYLELDQPDSARVEMLQADVKMREWGEQPEEDPFVRYLSGIVYEMLGEYDEAVVSYRQAVQVYRETTHKQAIGVPRQLKADLLNLLHRQRRTSEYRQWLQDFGMADFTPAPPDAASVVVILHHGTAPIRHEHAIQTFATELENVVRIALPFYRSNKPKLNRPVVNIDGSEQPLQTVEDVDALARAALQDDMPVITARAIARAVVKHNTHKKAKEKGELAGFLAKITNLATERADTRSWTTLPQVIQLARISVEPGEHEIKISMKNPAGFTIDRIKRTVRVPRGGLAVTSAHWAAPLVQNTADIK